MMRGISGLTFASERIALVYIATIENLFKFSNIIIASAFLMREQMQPSYVCIV